MLVAAMDRKRSKFQTKRIIHQGYSMLLIGELQAAPIPVLTALEIPGRGPIIPPFK